MEIPSTMSDIFFIIVIVMPGYSALYIFRLYSYLGEKFSDRDILYLSLTFSIVIYILTGFICNVQDFNEIKNIILVPSQAAILLTITILAGLLPGLGMRWWFNKNNISPGSAWDTAIEEAVESSEEEDLWLIVNTVEGNEYKGILNYYDIGDEANSLSLSRPIMILRDKSHYVINEFEMGKEIIFKGDNISRIVFLKEISDSV